MNGYDNLFYPVAVVLDKLLAVEVVVEVCTCDFTLGVVPFLGHNRSAEDVIVDETLAVFFESIDHSFLGRDEFKRTGTSLCSLLFRHAVAEHI